MERKRYISPEMVLMQLAVEDVVTASDPSGVDWGEEFGDVSGGGSGNGWD